MTGIRDLQKTLFIQNMIKVNFRPSHTRKQLDGILGILQG